MHFASFANIQGRAQRTAWLTPGGSRLVLTLLPSRRRQSQTRAAAPAGNAAQNRHKNLRWREGVVREWCAAVMCGDGRQHATTCPWQAGSGKQKAVVASAPQPTPLLLCFIPGHQQMRFIPGHRQMCFIPGHQQLSQRQRQ
eukprot:357723-Chlamydomonas_euryale.AAC.18